jgi:16S rRNA processing protein RimM
VRVDGQRAGGREVMVPFVGAIVPEVDVQAGTLTVTPPAGLFEELVDEAAAASGADPTEGGDDGDSEASDTADDRDE